MRLAPLLLLAAIFRGQARKGEAPIVIDGIIIIIIIILLTLKSMVAYRTEW